jgi:hypothetical protein
MATTVSSAESPSIDGLSVNGLAQVLCFQSSLPPDAHNTRFLWIEWSGGLWVDDVSMQERVGETVLRGKPHYIRWK